VRDDATTSVRLQRAEDYADTLRRKLQDVVAAHDESDRERQRLAVELTASEDRIRALEAELEDAIEEHNRLNEELAAALAENVEEIRKLRFELGEAQDTAVQAEELTTQLASDLFDTRGSKDKLERMLNDTGERARGRIESLEEKLKKKNAHIDELEEKLAGRSEAVNMLLSELARKSEEIKSIDDIDELIADLDEPPVHETFDDDEQELEQPRRREERVTRVLLGRMGEKLLRFPLFKDQLTIGRSDENDIQLEAPFISRRHAVVRTDGDTTRVIDWGSRNGVFVNSERVTEHLLANGDIVTIGNAHFRYDERPKHGA
jgi:DNA repair exonuclease SbcCD ATPase subunit